MATPKWNIYNPKYIGFLMFKHMADLLTRKEKKILSAWRKLPGNEKFFQDTMDPENLMKGIREFEEQQILIKKKLQQTFPDLPELSKN